MWRTPFLRDTLLYAAGLAPIFSGLALVMIASAAERGVSPVQIGAAFSR